MESSAVVILLLLVAFSGDLSEGQFSPTVALVGCPSLKFPFSMQDSVNKNNDKDFLSTFLLLVAFFLALQFFDPVKNPYHLFLELVFLIMK